MRLPVRIARRSMKFSFTLHCLASPRALSAVSMEVASQVAASRAVSCSAAKAIVSSKVRFLGSQTDSGGVMLSEKKKLVMSPNWPRVSHAGLYERGDGAEVLVREDGAAEGGEEFVGGELAEVFAVEPLELDEVEDRAAEGDALEVEFLEHLGEGEDVAFLGVEALADDLGFGGLGHAAAEQAEEVEHGLRQVTGLLVEDQ